MDNIPSAILHRKALINSRPNDEAFSCNRVIDFEQKIDTPSILVLFHKSSKQYTLVTIMTLLMVYNMVFIPHHP